MIKLEEWVDIVSLHRQGLSIKAIARRLDISRNTVRLALRRKEPPAYRPAGGAVQARSVSRTISLPAWPSSRSSPPSCCSRR